MSLLTDENLAGLCRLLKACGDVERVSGRILLLPRSGCCEHLPRVHADGDTQRDSALAHQGLAESRYCAACLDSRPHRAERVVLVHRRKAEEADHGVADVLLDPAAVALHRRGTGRRETVEDVVQRLRVKALGQLGRVGHVREENRHRPPDSGGAVDLVAHLPQLGPRSPARPYHRPSRRSRESVFAVALRTYSNRGLPRRARCRCHVRASGRCARRTAGGARSRAASSSRLLVPVLTIAL